MAKVWNLGLFRVTLNPGLMKIRLVSASLASEELETLKRPQGDITEDAYDHHPLTLVGTKDIVKAGGLTKEVLTNGTLTLKRFAVSP